MEWLMGISIFLNFAQYLAIDAYKAKIAQLQEDAKKKDEEIKEKSKEEEFVITRRKRGE